MPIAAVPDYLKNADDNNATPEMRFGMLLPIWSVRWEKVKDKEAQKVWDKIKKLTSEDQKRMSALHKRQRVMQSALGSGTCLAVEAKSIAPFTTGLGNEHPLENGFAFLNPYGLPYLPGSGVKGAVRRAAEELASGEWGESEWQDGKPYSITINKKDIALSMIDVLFGREPPKGDQNQVSGALSFWDVIPQIKGDKLMVEIMTPHQGHYYQDGKTPHDSGQPIPISFLTVPPGSGFSFNVVCDLAHLNRLAPGLVKKHKWKELLKAAFEHAFDWCGFGAKTSVGYGALKRLSHEEVDQARRESQISALKCEWVDSTITELVKQRKANDQEEAVRGKALAEMWSQIEDDDLKKRALADIKSRWEAKGWWEVLPGRSAKKAKEVYEGIGKSESKP